MKKHKTAIVLLLSLACVSATTALRPGLLRTRSAFIPSVSRLPRNAPPLVVFTTVAMGSLSGLAVDVLWARITTLQEQGKYAEIAPLADLITRLQPRLGEVWDYHSFNMAYNVSAMFSAPEDRWRWVLNGIRMLRDEALVIMPEDILLYDRICRIYMHKFVETADPARGYYRFAWAAEMTALLGGPQPDYAAVLSDPARSRVMMENYRLDPRLMLELDRRYGPFDWRMPQAHVVYWAFKARQYSGGAMIPSLDGLICEAVADTILDGRIVEVRPDEAQLVTAPRFDLLPKALRTFDDTLAAYRLKPDEESGFRDLYLFFLQRAIVSLYVRGETGEAMKLYGIVKEKLRDPESNRPLEEYVQFVPAVSRAQKRQEEQREKLLQEHDQSHD